MIRGYAGAAQRETVSVDGPVGPWRATISVEVVYLASGRHSLAQSDKVFEVAVAWTGPPAAGFPPSARPVQARDVYPVHDSELARALAIRAGEAFARPRDQPPDLRALAAELQRSTEPRHNQPAT